MGPTVRGGDVACAALPERLISTDMLGQRLRLRLPWRLGYGGAAGVYGDGEGYSVGGGQTLYDGQDAAHFFFGGCGVGAGAGALAANVEYVCAFVIHARGLGDCGFNVVAEGVA